MIATKMRDDSVHRSTPSVGQAILFSDGTFLLIAGGSGMLFDFLGHAGIGPLARAFLNAPYTAGFVEAHGLAVLASLLLYRGAAQEKKGFWHLYAVLIHLLLGGTNLLFWGIFISFSLIPLGVITTIAHGLFVLGQGICLVLAHRRLSPARHQERPANEERIDS
jgi:hypothetical protein